ncbi:hypothetical protein BC834DRAFT_918361 [Gloeopeniophorella convolvens]|nr:hypothetical protein BC834DRAFT_918361 [Gloeopeniophorella convolvens]
MSTTSLLSLLSPRPSICPHQPAITSVDELALEPCLPGIPLIFWPCRMTCACDSRLRPRCGPATCARQKRCRRRVVLLTKTAAARELPCPCPDSSQQRCRKIRQMAFEPRRHDRGIAAILSPLAAAAATRALTMRRRHSHPTQNVGEKEAGGGAAGSLRRRRCCCELCTRCVASVAAVPYCRWGIAAMVATMRRHMYAIHSICDHIETMQSRPP